MEHDEIWRYVVTHRRALGATLGTLDDEEWAAPSLCPGWTVKDVAAHVISHPQHTWGSFLPVLLRGRLDLNRMILLDGQRRGRAPVADILRQYDDWADVRHLPPTTTPLEALIDVLVHSQDLLRPLGRPLDLPPAAAAAATDRAFAHSRIFGRPRLGDVRLVATDVDWSRGSGPTVKAPMQEILMLATGRAADVRLVSGDGAGLVRTG